MGGVMLLGFSFLIVFGVLFVALCNSLCVWYHRSLRDVVGPLKL